MKYLEPIKYKLHLKNEKKSSPSIASIPIFCEGISRRYRLFDHVIVSIKDDLLKEPMDMKCWLPAISSKLTV